MTPYKNLNSNSGVIAYENGADYIKVQFRSGIIYIYTNISAGVEAIKNMQFLAGAGKGLSSFIAKHKPQHANKIEA